MTTIQQIANRIAQDSGHAFLIGGAVRDQIIGKPSKDFDIEVHGMTAVNLVSILSEFGQVDSVGASFGVLKVRVGTEDFDFSLPRRENKTGQGHKGFQVEVDPTMTTKEAARRRDFTMNALMQDILTGEIVDHFGGAWDLRHHNLSVVDPETFVEDPLRVLRGMQFCGRFGLFADQRTAQVCQQMIGEFDSLAVERVWTEWEKWASKSVRPSLGLRFLVDTGWLSLFPEIANLVNLEQETDWHPEGDVFEHTCQVVDHCASIADSDGLDSKQRMVLVFSGLCHDFGKADTTTINNGRITSHGHDSATAPFVKAFMKRIGAPSWLVDQVIPLCENHMFRAEPTPRSVRRLSVRVSPSSIEMLTRLMRADQIRVLPGQLDLFGVSHSHCRKCGRELTDPHSVAMGIGPVCAKVHSPSAILKVAREVACSDSQPQPVLMGRHLMPFMKPGPEMGQVLRDAFSAQLNGEFSTAEDGVAWVQSRL